MKFKHETIIKSINCPTCGTVASETIETHCREGNSKKDNIQDFEATSVFLNKKKDSQESLFERLKKSQ